MFFMDISSARGYSIGGKINSKELGFKEEKSMINAILAVLVLSVVVSFVTLFLISILAAVIELPIREVFSPKLFSEIWSNLMTSWSIKSQFAVMAVCMIAFTPCIFDAAEKISAANRGECICQCSKCKATAERVEAVIRYLALDDEDLYGVKEND